MLKKIPNIIARFAHENRGRIGGTATVFGILGTSVLSARAGYAMRQKFELHDVDEETTTRERVDIVWREFVPAAGCTLATCLVAVSTMRHYQQRTVLAIAAYSASELMLQELRTAMGEEVSVVKVKKIEDAARAKFIAHHEQPGPDSPVYIQNDDPNDVICLEARTGRYFRSSREKILRAVNQVNREALENDVAYLDTFYGFLGLPYTIMGGEMGWESRELLEVSFTSDLMQNGTPVLAFDYNYLRFV